jgi:hypothetical protein
MCSVAGLEGCRGDVSLDEEAWIAGRDSETAPRQGPHGKERR